MILNSGLKLKDVGRASAGLLVVEEGHRKGHRCSPELHRERNRKFMRVRLCSACVLFLTLTSLAYSQNYTLGSQSNFPPQLPRQSAAPVPTSQPQPTGGFEGSNPFFGSIAQGTATTEELPVSLTEAIDRGLRYNLGSLLSDQNARATRGARLVALSRLLPNVNARISESSQHGDYGVLGPSLANSHGTYTATVGLNIPIFQGGRVRGEIVEVDAVLEQRRAQLAELRGRIAAELRTAFLDLSATGEQVQVARNAVELAQQQLTQAQDRFTSGVANNLEVTQAQEAVATANENYISSLYAYNAAKATLGRAIGGAEKTIPALFQGVMP